jgi:hypothetical protein
VLGTWHAMQGTVYPRALAARGIAAGIPRADDRASLDKIIVSELVSGVCTNRAGQECVGLIERIAAGGCDSVAFACTEIRSCRRQRTRRPRAGLGPAASPRRSAQVAPGHQSPNVTPAVSTVPPVRPGALCQSQYRLVCAITLSGAGAPYSVRSSVVCASPTSVAS